MRFELFFVAPELFFDCSAGPAGRERAGIPGLLGSERGGGLLIDAFGSAGSALAGLGFERPDVCVARSQRTVRGWL